MWFVFFLGTFHGYLIGTNQTTNEYLKKVWRAGPSNPFTYGTKLENVFRLLFRDSFVEHFDRQMSVNLNFDTYSICPSKDGFCREQAKLVEDVDRTQTHAFKSVYEEKFGQFMGEKKNDTFEDKVGKGVECRAMDFTQDEKFNGIEEFYNDRKRSILNNKL